MNLAITGHRPDKLGGYSERVATALRGFAIDEMSRYVGQGDFRVYVGMAIGFDQAIAWACGELRIPFVACIPCDNHDAKWSPSMQGRSRLLLERADQVVVVSPGPYAVWKMQKRNEFMVDNADELLALWNGSSGGTANCVRYAERRCVPKVIIKNIWDKWERRLLYAAHRPA
jgi:uncharacterized phage-like protein YoqJ